MLTQEEANRLFKYDPITGIVTRKICMSAHTNLGDVVGVTPASSGYLQVRIHGKSYLLHRIIYLMLYGTWPEQVDHEDHIRTNNKKYNLKAATQVSNSRNQSKSANNTSGITGVSWDTARNKWAAQIRIKGKNVRLGRFTNKYKAIAVRKAAEVLYDFHPNHGT